MTENQPKISFFNTEQNVQVNEFEKTKNEIYKAAEFTYSTINEDKEEIPSNVFVIMFMFFTLALGIMYLGSNDTYQLKGILFFGGLVAFSIFLVIFMILGLYLASLDLKKLKNEQFQKQYIQYINIFIDECTSDTNIDYLTNHKYQLADSFANNKESYVLFYKIETYIRDINNKNKAESNTEKFLLEAEKDSRKIHF